MMECVFFVEAEELDDRKVQSVPPGFHVVFLPFADDFRKLKLSDQLPRGKPFSPTYLHLFRLYTIPDQKLFCCNILWCRCFSVVWKLLTSCCTVGVFYLTFDSERFGVVCLCEWLNSECGADWEGKGADQEATVCIPQRVVWESCTAASLR